MKNKDDIWINKIMKKFNQMFSCFEILLVFFISYLSISIILNLPIFFFEDTFNVHQIDENTGIYNIPQYSMRDNNHSIIAIFGNEELEKFGLIGSGTLSDPYTIDGFKIISNGSVASINITNTDVYIQINNCFLQNGTCGVALSNVSNIMILNNTFRGNINAISLSHSKNITISNNSLIDNQNGINLTKKNYDSLISNNIISNNSFNGITSYFSSSITISNNRISKSGDYGIYLSRSNNYTISYNNFSYNTLEAVFLNSSANYIIVRRNDFYNNNLNGVSQSYDSGIQDIFTYNYWNDWTTPDINDDGIVDNPYVINGDVSNFDPFPQTKPNINPFEEKIDSIVGRSSFIITTSFVLITSFGIVGSGVLIGKGRVKGRESVSFLKYSESEENGFKLPWIPIIITSFALFFSQILFPPQVRKLSHSKVLENPTRQQILKILKERGFEHYRALKSLLDCSVSVFEWHMRVLEDFRLIKVRTIGQYKVYFLRYLELDEFKLKIYFSIRSKKALDILDFLKTQPPKLHPIRNIAEPLNMNLATAIYHCQKLVSLKLLIKQSGMNNFMINENQREEIDWLIKRHQKIRN